MDQTDAAEWVASHPLAAIRAAIDLGLRARAPRRYIGGILRNWATEGYPPEVARLLAAGDEAWAAPPTAPAATAPALETEASLLWQRTLRELELKMAPSAYHTWLVGTRCLHEDDGSLVVATESKYARDWLQTRLRSLVQRTLSSLAGRALDVRFEVRERPTLSAASP